MSAIPTEYVTRIISRLNQGVKLKEVAREFGVSLRTISRLKHHYATENLHIDMLPTFTKLDLLDEVVAVKNHFALSLNAPMHWGWFTNWEGLHSLVSDGYILWESTDLVDYAQTIRKARIKEAPVFSHLAEELPTFELEALMCQDIGDKLGIVAENDTGLVQCQSKKHTVFLKKAYVTIARKMGLDIRLIKGVSRFVYLTKTRYLTDAVHIPIACVATLQEATNERYSQNYYDNFFGA